MTKKKKFYAVRVGRNPGIYTEWFGENGFKDYITGKPLTIDQAEKMKLDYYKEWGWVS